MKKIMSVSAVMVRISLNFNGEFYLAKGLNHSVDPSCKGLNRARWEGFFKKICTKFSCSFQYACRSNAAILCTLNLGVKLIKHLGLCIWTNMHRYVQAYTYLLKNNFFEDRCILSCMQISSNLCFKISPFLFSHKESSPQPWRNP